MKSSILTGARSEAARAELNRTPGQLQDIGENAAASASSLKRDAGNVARDAVYAAKNVGGQLADLARDKADTLSHVVTTDLDRVKAYVKDQPAKGLGFAFIAGALAALFLGRRS
ncbi:MAG: hypothetical protein V4621_03075 [Pseudomonadota bacterium]